MQKDAVIEKAVGIIREHLGRDYKVVLFGSWARGNALETSDIDIGILGKKEIPWSIMAEILQKIENIPSLRKIDVVDLHTKEKNFREKVLSYAKNL